MKLSFKIPEISIPANYWLIITKIIGFIFLILFTHEGDDQIRFAFILCLITLFAIRQRLPITNSSIYIDVFLCLSMMLTQGIGPYALLLVLFEAVVKKQYLALLAVVYFYNAPDYFLLLLVVVLAGYFLGRWESEIEDEVLRRFELKRQIYALEEMSEELAKGTISDVRAATVAERSRISRDIHDYAGHDIIAAFISFQTMQNFIEDEDVLEMYADTLERLSRGVGKIRDILHNLTPTVTPGINQIIKICADYPAVINFKQFGNMEIIEPYMWNTLQVCLKESLTNISKHAVATYIKVEIDVSTHIVRLYVENDGAKHNEAPPGRGMSNLRYRVNSLGGNLSSSNEDGIFRLICIIPIKEDEEND